MRTVEQQVVRPKTWAMQLVEAREGKTIEQLVEDLYVREGLTQAQVADRLGITNSALSRWMTALGIPTRKGAS
jgi:transcriptional regulator with XRE-family HTH domain